MFTSEATTRGIKVQVQARYLPERSRPRQGEWFFVYTVRLTNEGSEQARLMSRHWIITDANGAVEEVRGPGVIGQQPILDPGQSFEYTSACPLGTSFGSMRGTYHMVSGDGTRFQVEVAPFTLCEPHGIN